MAHVLKSRKIVRRRRRRGELFTMQAAIRNHCLECMGWENGSKEVAECSDRQCHLWPYRFGVARRKQQKATFIVQEELQAAQEQPGHRSAHNRE